MKSSGSVQILMRMKICARLAPPKHLCFMCGHDTALFGPGLLYNPKIEIGILNVASYNFFFIPFFLHLVTLR